MATTPSNADKTAATNESSTSAPPGSKSIATQPLPALNVYKKIAIIRKSTDVLTYEDAAGTLQTIADLGEAATTSAPTILQPKAKLDIPTPRITVVESYNSDVPLSYPIPTSYVRAKRPTADEVEYSVEYNIDDEDESWWRDHPRFGPNALSSTAAGTKARIANDAHGADGTKKSDGEKAREKGSGANGTEAAGGSAAGSSKTGGSVKKQKKGSSSKASSSKSSSSLPPPPVTPPSTGGDDAGATETAAAAVRGDDDLDDDSDDDGDLDDSFSLFSSSYHRRNKPTTLQLSTFERMIDILEKATGFETIVTVSQAERMLTSRIPQLTHAFGRGTGARSSSSTVSEAAVAAGGGGASSAASSSSSTAAATTTAVGTGLSASLASQQQPKQEKKSSRGTAEGDRQGSSSATATGGGRSSGDNVVTTKSVIQDIYNYWVQKRSKLKKPLLRKYWPVTASNDTNPHLVFRPREKEKYKLRKKRQNDMDAYRKMKVLRNDFDSLRVLLDLVRRREQLVRMKIELQSESFAQRLFDIVDTSGLPRVSPRLRKSDADEAMDVPKHFDTSLVGTSTSSGKKRKRNRRGSSDGGGNRSRSSSPVPGQTANGNGAAGGNYASARPHIVAGQDHGTPAPLFLHPLSTRESYVSSWEGAVPFVTSYVNSHPTPTFRFRHRPRIGRGGRVVIDRMPRPGHPNVPSRTVFTAGDGLPRSIVPSETSKGAATSESEGGGGGTGGLLDLLPTPLDREKLRRKIEEIGASGWTDDEEEKSASSSGGGGGGDGDENDGEEVLVPMEEWLETDEQLWGEERFAIGPV